MLLSVFNKVAHYLHLMEEWLVSIVHVSDCVTTLETKHIMSKKHINKLELLYGYNGISYKLHIPVNLRKDIGKQIFSATVDETYDITEHVKSLAGPFHNFFMQSMQVKDILPSKYHKNFSNLEIICEDLQISTYRSLYDNIHFHQGIDWPRYDTDAAIKTVNKLSYLDLSYYC